MPRKQKKFHYLYKTTNILNKKYYLGMHSTNNINDDYLGSGKRLRYSIRKHGKENHEFQILKYFNTRQELKEAEANLITESVLKDPLCMNLTLGGEGGGFHLKGYVTVRDDKGNTFSILKTDPRYISGELVAASKNREGNNSFLGKNHSAESKLKMSKIAKERKKENHSGFGTCWVYSNLLKESKRINKLELNDWIMDGWYKGRKMKFKW